MQYSPQAARQRNFVDCVSLQQRWQGRYCTTEFVRLHIQELERTELPELSGNSARQFVEAKVETTKCHCRTEAACEACFFLVTIDKVLDCCCAVRTKIPVACRDCPAYRVDVQPAQSVPSTGHH